MPRSRPPRMRVKSRKCQPCSTYTWRKKKQRQIWTLKGRINRHSRLNQGRSLAIKRDLSSSYYLFSRKRNLYYFSVSQFFLCFFPVISLSLVLEVYLTLLMFISRSRDLLANFDIYWKSKVRSAKNVSFSLR